MSKLLERLKKEAKELKEKEATRTTTFEKINWLNVKKGDNIIRILPNKNPDDVFYKTVNIHYIDMKKKDGSNMNVPVRCLTDFGKGCPLCTAYKDMVSDESTKDKASKFKKIERYLYNVIDYNEGKTFIYAAPYTVHQGVMEWVGELDVDISDIEIGHDFKLIKEVDAKKGVQFGTSYKVRPKLKPSALPSKLKGLLDDRYDLESIYAEERLKDIQTFLESMGIEFEIEEEPKKKSLKKKEKEPEPEPKKKFKKKPEPEPEEEEEEEEFASGDDDGFASGDDGFASDEEEELDDDLERELRELGA